MVNLYNYWIALFSQTGSELYEVSKKVGRFPDLIIFNTIDICNSKKKPIILNSNLFNESYKSGSKFIILPSRPTIWDYKNNLRFADIVTLHGWLRIIPSEVCKEYEIFNGHPGLITEYPELKGQDPQIKAVKLKLPESGCVIHKVSEGVDEGEIFRSVKTSIKDLSIDEVIPLLHNKSVELWADFLKERV
jgi:methionyl-tRNA formyltransferase